MLTTNKVLAQADDLSRLDAIKGLFSGLSTEADLEVVKKALKRVPVSSESLTPIYEAIEVSESWLNRDGREIAQWLERQQYSTIV